MDRTKAVVMQRRIVCPVCGYRMPYSYGKDAECRGVVIRCKNNKCKVFFELVIKDGKQTLD
jgi:hypothetical protein